MVCISTPRRNLAVSNSLVERLQKDYPDFRFISGRRFSFHPPKTIVIGPDEGEKTPLLIFHELGHALSKRYRYNLAVERLKIEALAWQEAKKAYAACRVSARYPDLPPWDDDFAEDQLDTYRDWLHQKSKCPFCKTTMYQDSDKIWRCPYCNQFKSQGLFTYCPPTP